jgi:lipopolysaccharide transport system ATP-binding protein
MCCESTKVISVNKVEKYYRLYDSPADRLWELLPWIKPRFRRFQALETISFDLERGESIGLVGRNGAGKSTLLQLICGTVQPSAGNVVVNGRVAALLELGAGFNPEFSGCDNVWMNASILGMSEADIAAQFDAIVAFSEIGEAIEQPVKTYSSGMFLRLAFSVAVHASPEILVIDEALSVGDGAFAKKSFDKIMALRDQGCTLLFCSHALYQVEALCQKAIWLHQGQMVMFDEVSKVTASYQAWLESGGQTPPSPDVLPHQATELQHSPASSGGPRIIKVDLLKNGMLLSDKSEEETCFISSTDDLTIQATLEAPDPALQPQFAVVIERSNGMQVCSFSTEIDGVALSWQQGRCMVSLSVPKLPLLKGQYIVEAFLLCDQGIMVYEHLRRVCRFCVTQSHLELGVVHLTRKWQVNS